MPAITFIQQDHQRLDIDLNGVVLRNMFPVGDGGEPNGAQFMSAPGLFERARFGFAPCRGLHFVDGGPDTKIKDVIGNTLYAVYGGSLYGVNENLRWDLIWSGLSNVDSSSVRMASTRDQLCIVSDGKAYVWNGSAMIEVMPDWVDADTPFEPSDVVAMGGRFVWSMARKVREETDGSLTVVEKGDRIRWADIEDGASVDVLDFITASSAADEIVALASDGLEVMAFGASTVQFVYQTGDATAALAIDINRTLPIGALGRDSVMAGDNTVYFVDNSFRFCRLVGSQYEVISQTNDSAEARIRAVPPSQRPTVKVWFQHYDGHPFVAVDVPGDASLVFDVKTRMMHERKSWDGVNGYSQEWIGHFTQAAFGRTFVGSKLDGRLYTFQSRADSEAGETFERVVTALVSIPSGTPVMSNVCLHFRTGLAALTERSGVVEMRYKKRGDRWSAWRGASMQARGERINKAIWRRLGRASSRQFEVQFRVTDPQPFYVDGATFNEARP